MFLRVICITFILHLLSACGSKAAFDGQQRTSQPKADPCTNDPSLCSQDASPITPATSPEELPTQEEKSEEEAAKPTKKIVPQVVVRNDPPPVVSEEEPPAIELEPEIIVEEVEEEEEEIDTSEKIVIQEGELSIKFIDETAGFRNTLGYYEISDSGAIINTKIIWADASHSSDHLSAAETELSDGPLKVGDTFLLGKISKKTRISFFLVADGFRQNNWSNPESENYINSNLGDFAFRTSADYANSDAATIESKSPYLFFVPSNGQEPILIESKTDIDDDEGSNSIYHAAYDEENSLGLNPDNHNHIKHTELEKGRKWLIGVEDLLYSPDRDGSTFDGDYMDLTFEIMFDPIANNFSSL